MVVQGKIAWGSLALVAVAALGVGTFLTPPTPATPTTIPVSASPSTVAFACPPGAIDPFNSERTAGASLWASSLPSLRTPAPQILTHEGGEVPTTLALSGQGGGELAGMSALGCSPALTSQWIAAGATTAGADIVLTLANPGAATSLVRISGYGTSGPLGDAPRQVSVPAGGRVSVLVASWFPDEAALALHLSADGGGVSAWAQTSFMNGDIPHGQAIATALQPARTHTILGITPSDSSVVRLVAPQGEDTDVNVFVVDSSGTHSLEGGSLSLAQASSVDLPLNGATVDTTPIALVVSSTQPIIAQTTSVTVGAPWAERGHAWILRSINHNSAPLVSTPLPGAEQIRTMAESVLAENPIRATSLETQSGVHDVRVRLLVLADAEGSPTEGTNNTDEGATEEQSAPTPTPNIWAPPTDPQSSSSPQSGGVSADTTGAIPLNVGGTTSYIAPGVPTLLSLPEAPSTLSAPSPVRVVLLIEADTPVGTMQTVWTAGVVGTPALHGAITVQN